MKYAWRMSMMLAGSILVAAPLAAQGGQRGAQRGMQQPPPPRRAALLREIQVRFMNQARNQMRLTPEQWPRFQKVAVSWAQKRMVLEDHEQQLVMALRGQYRIGVAANPDSVPHYVDELNITRAQIAETYRDEMRELTPILTPVQLGQFQVLRDRQLQMIRDLQQKRPAGEPGPQP
jgi:hypothetical protein